MLNGGDLGLLLKQFQINFFSGVPCSYLKPLINYACNELDYVPAANEGEAVAIAFGARLAGKYSAVLMQNSGLTNALSPLTSLTNVAASGIFGFVGFRGEPGKNDEPQHMIMGSIGSELLRLCGVYVETLSDNLRDIEQQFKWAIGHIDKGRSVFFLVPENHISSVELLSSKPKLYQQGTINRHKKTELNSRYDVLNTLHKRRKPQTLLMATTGKTGRELFAIEDHPGNFYMVGSMGCVSSIGLGLALNKAGSNVIALDGDGALLMRLGNLSTNGRHQPDNLLHILLDNQCHDSTGGQRTASFNMDWVLLAQASGYPCIHQVYALDELDGIVYLWQEKPCLTFVHIRILAGSISSLPRPDKSPSEVYRRLQQFIQNNC
ncbi:phosphonopyruvate decarboxylase [Shewanella surugensis]|uniref:Phosphonopyruvate decarboxylase n=1 Tax=Shewanella surugensis TaxID=212020 RepID=A0ABT0LHP1_9GAMM|nr:phosphonopyruvate decarboxylase [Shewanella surugensis]MCL1127223.1 phosphonopyruvate decarboxylase [Shewanella surugensis]